MDETTDVIPESSPEEVVETVEETPVEAPAPKETPKAERTVPYDRFKEVNDELAKLKKQPPQIKTSLDVEDFLDISASLDGLDQKQKEYLAREHKLSNKPLAEIRNSEDFLLWNEGYKSKVEKERSLKPSNTQPDSERKRTATEQITSAKTLVEQEEMLKKYGLYKEHRPRADRRNIG